MVQVDVCGASRPTRAEAEAAIRVILAYIGEDPSRERLVDTPRRVIATLDDFYAGYRRDPSVDLARVFSDVQGYDGIVALRGIPFVTHCEGDMRPMIGKAHIAYYPNDDGVVGLSKLARLVETYALRLQSPERLIKDISSAIDLHLRPRGCGIALELRKLVGTDERYLAVKTEFSGCFTDDLSEQSRFLTLIAHEASLERSELGR